MNDKAMGGGVMAADQVQVAKDYLSQAYCIDQRINAKLEQVARLRSLAQQVTTSFGHKPVSRTRNVSSMEDTILKIMAAEKNVDAKIDLLLEKKADIEGVIRLAVDPNARLPLELRVPFLQAVAGDCRRHGLLPGVYLQVAQSGVAHGRHGTGYEGGSMR